MQYNIKYFSTTNEIVVSSKNSVVRVSKYLMPTCQHTYMYLPTNLLENILQNFRRKK